MTVPKIFKMFLLNRLNILFIYLFIYLSVHVVVMGTRPVIVSSFDAWSPTASMKNTDRHEQTKKVTTTTTTEGKKERKKEEEEKPSPQR